MDTVVAKQEVQNDSTTTTPGDKDGGAVPTPILTAAPPPWHTSVTIGVLLAYFAAMIPEGIKSMDEDAIAHKETFLHVNFPSLLTIRQVAWIRIFLGAVMIADTIYAVLYGHWEQDTEYYYPYSKLKVVKNIEFRGYMYTGSVTSGLMTLSSFTMVSWCFEGVAFLLLGGIPLYLEYYCSNDNNPPSDAGGTCEPPRWVYRTAIILWEICAPTSMLVSAIVKYVLWPSAAEQGENNIKVFKHIGALLEHNWNVLSCLVEVALLGGLPIRYRDFVWAPLFGLVYVLFSYAMTFQWAPADQGPQFMYPFLDTTMGWLTTVCLLALLGVLALSFAIFGALDHFITESLQEEDLLSHVAAVLVIGFCVCRFY